MVRFALILFCGLAVAQDDPALEKRVRDLSSELRCLVCQNQTLADSNAPRALDLRNQGREQPREREEEVSGGKIAREDYDRWRREMEGRLLADVDATQASPPSRRPLIPWVAGVAIPVLAVGVYFAVGSPRMIEREAEEGV